MSFGTWIAIGVVFFITYAVSDWIADKTIKLIKKSIAKRREKKFVSYVKPLEGVMPQGTGKTISVVQKNDDFGISCSMDEILPAEELFEED